MTNLYIKANNKRSLKSGYYYWMIVIGRLTNLQTLIINDSQGYFNSALKYAVKGFKYFKQNGGSLKKIAFHQVRYAQEDKLYSCLKECPDIESLHFQNCTLSIESCKNIGKILSDYKNIREIDLSNSVIYA